MKLTHPVPTVTKGAWGRDYNHPRDHQKTLKQHEQCCVTLEMRTKLIINIHDIEFK